MEPRGCNRGQSLANRVGAVAAETSQNRCHGPMCARVAAGSSTQGTAQVKPERDRNSTLLRCAAARLASSSSISSVSRNSSNGVSPLSRYGCCSERKSDEAIPSSSPIVRTSGPTTWRLAVSTMTPATRIVCPETAIAHSSGSGKRSKCGGRKGRRPRRTPAAARPCRGRGRRARRSAALSSAPRSAIPPTRRPPMSRRI